jgi:hypothetical protein
MLPAEPGCFIAASEEWRRESWRAEPAWERTAHLGQERRQRVEVKPEQAEALVLAF